MLVDKARIDFGEGLDEASGLILAPTISRTLLFRTSLPMHITLSSDSSSPIWCQSAFAINASSLNLRPFEIASVSIVYHSEHGMEDEQDNCSLIMADGESSIGLSLIPPSLRLPTAGVFPSLPPQEHIVCSNTTGRYTHLPFPMNITESVADILANARLVTAIDEYTQLEDYHLGYVSSVATSLTRLQYTFDELEWIDYHWALGDGVWVSSRGYITVNHGRGYWTAFAFSDPTSMGGIGCWDDGCNRQCSYADISIDCCLSGSMSYSVHNNSLLLIQWGRLTHSNISFNMGLFRNGVVWADGPNPQQGGGLHIRT